MRGKLKPLEEIRENGGKGTNNSLVYHSKANQSIGIGGNHRPLFGNILEIKIWEKFHNRTIYMPKYEKRKMYDNTLFYDEWFEWIGEEPEILPKELWDIGDW